MIRQICIKVSERAPEFGIGNLVAELLQDPSNWDTLLIGLRSLIAILLSAPARLLTSQKDVEIEVGLDTAIAASALASKAPAIHYSVGSCSRIT